MLEDTEIRVNAKKWKNVVVVYLSRNWKGILEDNLVTISLSCDLYNF